MEIPFLPVMEIESLFPSMMEKQNLQTSVSVHLYRREFRSHPFPLNSPLMFSFINFLPSILFKLFIYCCKAETKGFPTIYSLLNIYIIYKSYGYLKFSFLMSTRVVVKDAGSERMERDLG